MDILNSSWLLGMLDKSSSSAQQRLLNLFDILADWLQAPHIRESLDLQDPALEQTPGPLLQYLTDQSAITQVRAPEILAHQLYFMLLAALQQELQAPGCNALLHAKHAAQALVHAQCLREDKASRLTYGLAASLVFVAGLSSFLMFGAAPQEPLSPVQAADLNKAPLAAALPASYANPAHTAAMYAHIEQMRNGVCHYPEALMLPEAQHSVYLQNVVGGEISSNALDQALASRLMQRVRCDYAPMLMKNSLS